MTRSEKLLFVLTVVEEPGWIVALVVERSLSLSVMRKSCAKAGMFVTAPDSSRPSPPATKILRMRLPIWHPMTQSFPIHGILF